MRVETQDGTYTAVRQTHKAHNALVVTADSPGAFRALADFLVAIADPELDDSGTAIHQTRREQSETWTLTDALIMRDASWVAFLSDHTQDVRYTAFPIIAEQMFD